MRASSWHPGLAAQPCQKACKHQEASAVASACTECPGYQRPDRTLDAWTPGGGGAGTACCRSELGAMPGGRPRGPEMVDAMRVGCVELIDVTRTLPIDGCGARPM